MTIHTHKTSWCSTRTVWTTRITSNALTVVNIVLTRWRLITECGMDIFAHFSTIITLRTVKSTFCTILLPFIITIWTLSASIVILGRTGQTESMTKIAYTCWTSTYIRITIIFRPVICTIKSVALRYWEIEIGWTWRDADVVSWCTVRLIVEESRSA
jgi:hypothetical protein